MRMMSTTPHQPASRAWQHAKLALAWAVFVTYGSLVPLEFKPNPHAWQQFLHTPWLQLGVGSRADWVANILLYVVLAYFGAGAVWTMRATRGLRVVLLVLVLAACVALAVGIEFAQLSPPRRVAQRPAGRRLGTAIGAALWFVSGQARRRDVGTLRLGGTNSIRAAGAVARLGLSFFRLSRLAGTSAKLARRQLQHRPGLAQPSAVSAAGGALWCRSVCWCSRGAVTA